MHKANFLIIIIGNQSSIFLLCNRPKYIIMIDLYQNEGIVAEPAGALAVAALSKLKNLRNKTVVCILSGGNNDIMRYPEIMERSLAHRGLKHYYLVEFAFED